jgi:50S ribosomal protein L16 3-hydroxylase
MTRIVPPPAPATATPLLIELLLGDLPLPRFLAEHYLRAPFLRAGTAASLRELADDGLLERLVERSACELTLVRDGVQLALPRPASVAEVLAHEAAGCSLVCRHAERHCPALACLAGSMAHAFHGTVDLHVYRTPAGHHGFGWHYDAEEVFIIQTAGIKDYHLRRNTVVEAPLLEDLPPDLGFARESSPLVTWRLRPGDWLYIPSGWWHRAEAIEPSVSLSLGVMAATPLAVLDHVRARLAASPAWRRRLPPTGWAGAATASAGYLDLLATLADELAREFKDPGILAGFVEARRRDAQRQCHLPELGTLAVV